MSEILRRARGSRSTLGGLVRYGVGLAALVALAGPARGQQPADEYGIGLDRAQIEEFLRVAEVVDREPIGKGVTRSERLTLSDGTRTLHASWKTINVHEPGLWRGDRGELQFDFRDSWKHEVAAYELDKLLGLGLVPPAVERRIDGHRGAVQLWLEDVMTELERRKQQADPQGVRAIVRWRNQWHCIRLLQQLTYNTDYQNIANILVDPEFRLHAIDFSRAFRIQQKLLGPDDLSCFSRTAIERLRGLDRATLEKRLGDLLVDMQIDGLLERRDKILEVVETRIAEKGEGQTFFY